MGTTNSNEKSKNAVEQFQLNQHNMKFVKQLEDPRYGQCQIYRVDGIDHSIALVKKVVPHDSETQIKALQDEAQELMSLDHESLIKLLNFEITKKSELCSAYWNSCFYFEYANNTLEVDMQRRQKEEIFYEESELWHIIVSVVSSLAYLRSRGIEHGDIRPSSLLLNEEGKIKLLAKPISQSTSSLNNYTQALMGIHKAKYLSPLLLKSLEQQYQHPQHNCSKSDVFSLALIIIEAALLQEQDDIYNFQQFEIIAPVLSTKLQYVKERYSENLYQFLEQLLIFDEMERPDVDIIFGYLEEMCRSGVRMSEHIYTSSMRERQPTYNYTTEGEENKKLQDHPNDHIVQDSSTKIQENPISHTVQLKAAENKQNINNVPHSTQSNHVSVNNIEFNSQQNGNYHVYESGDFQTPLQTQISPEKYQQPPVIIQEKHVGERQEKIRRSKWTLDENNDNNIYIDPSKAYQEEQQQLLQIRNRSNYTFADQPQTSTYSQHSFNAAAPSYQTLNQIPSYQQYQQQQASGFSVPSQTNIEVINSIISKYTKNDSYV